MVNLKKGETAVIKANSFTVGLGWDTKCDLDAHAYIYEGKSETGLLSKMLNDRIVFLQGEVRDDMANLIVSQLLYIPWSILSIIL